MFEESSSAPSCQAHILVMLENVCKHSMCCSWVFQARVSEALLKAIVSDASKQTNKYNGIGCRVGKLAIIGILPQKNLSSKPHILDSNGAWKSSFRSEEPKNLLKLKILVSKLVPWDLEATRTDLVNCPTRQSLLLSIGSLHWLSRFPYPDNKEI